MLVARRVLATSTIRPASAIRSLRMAGLARWCRAHRWGGMCTGSASWSQRGRTDSPGSSSSCPTGQWVTMTGCATRSAISRSRRAIPSQRRSGHGHQQPPGTALSARRAGTGTESPTTRGTVERPDRQTGSSMCPGSPASPIVSAMLRKIGGSWLRATWS